MVRLSPSATAGTFINPMDINPNYADDEDPLSLKSDFILSLCELIVGGRSGLAPVEKTVIDRCVRTIYRPYLADPAPERMPILQDLYNELLKQSGGWRPPWSCTVRDRSISLTTEPTSRSIPGCCASTLRPWGRC